MSEPSPDLVCTYFETRDFARSCEALQAKLPMTPLQSALRDRSPDTQGMELEVLTCEDFAEDD
jgi:hypothetical protein